MSSTGKWALAAAGAAVSAGIWLYRENREIEVELLPVRLPGLPAAFTGMKIVLVSDLHLPHGGANPDRAARLIAMQRPDAVCIAGDLLNSYEAFDREGLDRFARRLASIAPCYAVAGNHELRNGWTADYADILQRAGVRYLQDDWTLLERDGEGVTLYGMARRKPRPLPAGCPHPVIALAHRPELFPLYAQAGWDLILSGHAHGGQIRIRRQGLFAPGQGTFPTYTSGLYRLHASQMAVSRGLGNSTFPLRVGNRLHLPVLALVP